MRRHQFEASAAISAFLVVAATPALADPANPNNVPNGHVQVFNSSGALAMDFSGTSALMNAVTFADGFSRFTVAAGDGTYTGDLEVTTPMTIMSSHGGNHVTTVGNGTNNQANAAVRVEPSATNVQIGLNDHGLIINMGPQEEAAVLLNPHASYIGVEGNTLVGQRNGGITYGLVTGGGNNFVSIDRNTFQGNPTFAVYVNGNSNVNDPCRAVAFQNNRVAANLTVVLDTQDGSSAVNNNFDQSKGVIALQSPGDYATQNNVEVQTINGGFTLHDSEVLVTSSLGGTSFNFAGEPAELDHIVNWKPDVGINLADNWLGSPPAIVTAKQQVSGSTIDNLSNNGVIELSP